ncbi:MAG: hypothetical protein WC713_03135 [Candidatus Methylomirabilota bacterium]
MASEGADSCHSTGSRRNGHRRSEPKLPTRLVKDIHHARLGAIVAVAIRDENSLTRVIVDRYFNRIGDGGSIEERLKFLHNAMEKSRSAAVRCSAKRQRGSDLAHLVPQGEEPDSTVGPRLPDAPIRRRFEKPNSGLLVGDEGRLLQRNPSVSPQGDLPGFRHPLLHKSLKGPQCWTGIRTEHPEGLRCQESSLHVGVVLHHGLQVRECRLEQRPHRVQRAQDSFPDYRLLVGAQSFYEGLDCGCGEKPIASDCPDESFAHSWYVWRPDTIDEAGNYRRRIIPHRGEGLSRGHPNEIPPQFCGTLGTRTRGTGREIGQ